MSYHIHYSWGSSDCDGKYDGGGILRKTTGELIEGDDFDMQRSALDFVFKLPDVDVTEIVAYYEDREDGRLVIRSSRATEEGFDGADAIVCDEDCDLDERDEFRDHTAEAAGY